MDKVLVFCPTYRLEHETHLAIFDIAFDCPRDYLFTHDNPRDTKEPGGARLNVQNAYARGREMFLAGEYTHLLIVESDIIPPPDAWMKLRALGKPVASALYCFRPKHSGWDGLNATPLRGGDVNDSYSFHPEQLAKVKDGTARVSGVGLGCCLIERSVMEAIPFRGSAKQHCDWPFWQDVLANSLEGWCDFTVRCGHKDVDRRIYWPFGEEPEWFGEVRRFVPYEPIEDRSDMMKIRALCSFAGPYGSLATGQVNDVEDWLAKDWIEAGFAVKVEEAKPKKKRGAKENKALRAKENK